jgi:selenocysteine lyase/cysteine desulfurase
MNATVYLDYAATTPVDAGVAAQMAQCLTIEGTFGNPGSSSHEYGDRARAVVDAARRQVAAAVGAETNEVIWTSVSPIITATTDGTSSRPGPSTRPYSIPAVNSSAAAGA